MTSNSVERLCLTTSPFRNDSIAIGLPGMIESMYLPMRVTVIVLASLLNELVPTYQTNLSLSTPLLPANLVNCLSSFNRNSLKFVLSFGSEIANGDKETENQDSKNDSHCLASLYLCAY